ncbi:MAG TPA: nucleotidyltransferase family protein [Anaeromyxobacter sp.]|nr:nucleotidyltransferase family protein [Anaeromyxobacter sp.]
MALLDAVRAVTSFDPPPTLPECDLEQLVHVLTAHGLAPLASYQVEHTRLGAGLPATFREALLGQYQGVVNDNVLKLVGLRGSLRAAPDVPVIVLEAAAYVDWLYPHMAFRPVGDLRIALRGADAERFATAVKDQLQLARTEQGGRVAVFTDGRITVTAQEGLWPGGPPDEPLFERRVPYRAFGPSVARPSPEDAFLCAVGDQAIQGLLTPLITWIDVRELLRLPLDADGVRARAAAVGLSRALYGVSRLVAHFFPEVAPAAERLRPALAAAERAAIDRVVEAAQDPARLRHVRGTEELARLVVAP